MKNISYREEMTMGRVVHVSRDPYDVYIGRANRRAGLEGSVWANPFRIGAPHPETGEPIQRGEAVVLFKEWIVRGKGRHLLKRLGELEREVLSCWCAPKGGVGAHDPLICHGQILLLLLEHRRRVMEKKRREKAKDASTEGMKEGRYLFCGSRGWTDPALIRKRLRELPEGAVVVVGGARGADRLAEVEARGLGFEVEVYHARWEEEGRGAGFRRNERMLALPEVRGVLAFRMPGKSSGTDHMVCISQKAGVETEIIYP